MSLCVQAALVILAGAGGVYALVRTWAWSKRAGRVAIDFMVRLISKSFFYPSVFSLVGIILITFTLKII